MHLSLTALTLRLLLSVILGGLIGLEREYQGRPAGFRTHILVALSSTLLMIISAYGFASLNWMHDPARLAAQVVSGMGFLGAGTIMREGVNIRGLTTAASLWTVAAIGLAVGIGMYYAAVITTFFVGITLFYLARFEFGGHAIRITVHDQAVPIERIFPVLNELNISISQLTVNDQANGTVMIEFVVNAVKKHQFQELVSKLQQIPEIIQITVS